MTRQQQQEEIKKLTDRILLKLDKVSNNIDKIISDIAVTKDTSNLFWIKINNRIKSEYEFARKICGEFILNNFPDYYKDQIKDSLSRIKNKKINLPKTVTANDLISTHGSNQSLKSLMNETINTYLSGFTNGESTIRKLALLTQQINIEEKKIEKAITEGYIETGTYKGSKVKLRQELLKKSIDGKYITIIDKNGNAEQWKTDTYAEMVTRTKLMEVSAQSVLDTANAVGGDLVQVSAHNTLCAICAEVEGKIFSISGSDSDFPPLDFSLPLHPNCMHSLSVTFKNFLEQQGTLNDYIDFSNGNTEIHPTRTAWIPVSKRNLH